MTSVAVTGTIAQDGTFRPGWWSVAPDSPPTANVSADWSVAALDEDERVLAAAPAVITELPCSPAGPAARFRAALPVPAAAAFVVVTHAGAETYRRPVPPPAGVHLEFDEAEGALSSGEPLHVPVRISGPIGPGSHLIALWESPFQRPLPLGLTDLGSGASAVVTVDLSTLPGGDACRLRVVYNDGVRTTEVASRPLAVPARPATPVIEAPASGHSMSEHGWLSLRGRLDGDGDPAALQWLLDGTPIGRGAWVGHARPGVGRHTLTLRHGDESASIPITVTAAPEPTVPPAWQPPWRSRPLTKYGTPARPTSFGNRPEFDGRD